MYKNKEILAVVPARGGSKRIKNKNLAPLSGKPLMWYTFQQAKKSKYISRIIVSTEDKLISDFSKKQGFEVIKRPKNLTKDTTPTIPILQHVIITLEKIENYKPDLVVILQPTSPLRKAKDIDLTIKKLLKTKSDSAETVCPVEHHPACMFRVIKNNAIPINKKDFVKRKQDLPVFYRENGAVYVIRTDILMEENTLCRHNHKVVIMPVERSVDIDKLADLKFAEFLMKEKDD